MELERYALFFKQDYLGGYRFLDHCGEYLIRAEDEMDMLVVGDPVPTGGKMEKPEIGLKVEFNTVMLRVTYEQPGSENDKKFIEYAKYFAELYEELFSPRNVERNGVAVQCYRPHGELKLAERESLRWQPDTTDSFGRQIGMVPTSQTSEYRFDSGSRSLTVKMHPVIFEKIQAALKTPNGKASAYAKQSLERHNTGSRRILQKDFKYALFVELDLLETMPPENSIDELAAELFAKEPQVIKHFGV